MNLKYWSIKNLIRNFHRTEWSPFVKIDIAEGNGICSENYKKTHK
jgi:hypothetical protein